MKRTVLFFWLIILTVICKLAFFSGKPAANSPEIPISPQKIISLSPAITESLFALGLGDQIAAITKFCAWPPETAQKPKIGGFREINLEAIIRAEPDLIIMPKDMAHFKEQIEDLGVPVLLFDSGSFEGFIQSVKSIGELCGKVSEAANLLSEFENASVATQKEERAAVLFVLLNPDEYDRAPEDVTIIGNDDFYSEIIRAAGGNNAYIGKIPYPRLSLEALFKLNPDIIVIAAPHLKNREKLKINWRKLKGLKAVKNGKLLFLDDPGDTIPGPRSLGTIKKISQVINGVNGHRDERHR